MRSATNFGDKALQKRLALSQAAQSLTAAFQGLKPGIDPLQSTLGRPSASLATAVGLFPGIGQPNIGASAENIGLNLLGQAGANARAESQINTSGKDFFDKFGAITSGLGSSGLNLFG